MGLLDDAIREHLELKRLRGADPGAVAREEQDALGPVRRRDQADHANRVDGESDSSSNDSESFLNREESAPTDDSATVGQETVEINMELELASGAADSGGEPGADHAERAEPVAHPLHARALDEESLEWEMQGDHADDHGHGTESEGEGSHAGRVHDEAEHVEDVLEETPDFLRETPEQERLWFEQQPPRDFDFNE